MKLKQKWQFINNFELIKLLCLFANEYKLEEWREVSCQEDEYSTSYFSNTDSCMRRGIHWFDEIVSTTYSELTLINSQYSTEYELRNGIKEKYFVSGEIILWTRLSESTVMTTITANRFLIPAIVGK